MNTFLGKFIVEKNYASQGDVLDALNSELQQQPTVIGVIRELSFIDDAELMELLAESSSNQKSILQVIREKDILTDDQFNEIIKRKIDGGPSLLQVMVDKGKMTVDKAASIASEYSKYIAGASETTDEQIEVFNGSLQAEELNSLEEESNDEEPEVSLVALESLKELGIATEEQLAMLEKVAKEVELVEEPTREPAIVEEVVDVEEVEVNQVESSATISSSPFISEYLNQFDDFAYDELLHISKQLVNGLDKDKISEAHTYLSGFLGSAKLAGLNYSVKMFHAWVKLFENILDNKIDFSNINFLKVSGTLKKSIKVAKEFRDALEIGIDEAGALKDSTLKKSYLDTMKTLLEFLGIKN